MDDESGGDDKDGLTSGSGGRHFHLQGLQCSCACENGSVENGSAETTIAKGGQNPVAGFWGHTLGES